MQRAASLGRNCRGLLLLEGGGIYQICSRARERTGPLGEKMYSPLLTKNPFKKLSSLPQGFKLKLASGMGDGYLPCDLFDSNFPNVIHEGRAAANEYTDCL